MVCIDLRNKIGLIEYLTGHHMRSHSGTLVGDTATTKGDKGNHFYDFSHSMCMYSIWNGSKAMARPNEKPTKESRNQQGDRRTTHFLFGKG